MAVEGYGKIYLFIVCTVLLLLNVNVEVTGRIQCDAICHW